jgi:ElaB/YqjD/DUF883 family membrane-anchored ribosome-binding protein
LPLKNDRFSDSIAGDYIVAEENLPLWPVRRKKNINKPKNKKNMSKETQAVGNDIGQLAEDAHALMAATADVAGEKVGEARKRLATVLDRAKQIAGNVRDKAVAGAKAADEAVHEHPDKAIAIGVGVGAILGFLLARRCARNCD